MARGLDRPGEDGYLCGQCFTPHQKNDVLFGTNRVCTSCDVRQAVHRRAFDSPENYETWCRKGESRILLDWKDFPASHWRIRGGVLQQVQENTGVWFGQRVCPSCHSAVEEVQRTLLVGWSTRGMDMVWAANLLLQGGWEALPSPTDNRENVLEYARFLHGGWGTVLAVPVGLRQDRDGYVAACVKRCGLHAACALLRLELPAMVDLQSRQQVETGAAQDVFSNFLEFAGYVGQQLTLPTAVLVEGLAAGEDVQEQLKQHATQLFNRLQNCLKKPLLVGWDGQAATAQRIGDWLAHRMSFQDEQTERSEETYR